MGHERVQASASCCCVGSGAIPKDRRVDGNLAGTTEGDAVLTTPQGWSERGGATPAHRSPAPSVQAMECRL
eukprot:968700-Amphidinium_carterae.1